MRLVLVIGNSIRQWFLSQSAYINPIKLSVGKAVRVCVISHLYAWCTLNFDLMTQRVGAFRFFFVAAAAAVVAPFSNSILGKFIQ